MTALILETDQDRETDAFDLYGEDYAVHARRRVAELRAAARAMVRGERPQDARLIEELEIAESLMVVT